VPPLRWSTSSGDRAEADANIHSNRPEGEAIMNAAGDIGVASATLDGATARGRFWRIVGGAAMAAALGGLILVLAHFLAAANLAIRFPFELDYGEGIVWEQMRLIFDGRGYGPIEGFPAIVFHYPPLYHAIVEGVSTVSGMDPLAAGRLVSLAASLLCGLFVALIAARVTRPSQGSAVAWTCAAFAALTALAFEPVAVWGALMRVDMVAIAFSLAGVYFAIRALDRPSNVHIASLLVVAAVFTKQTSLAAPAAAFFVLLLVRPRTAIAGMATCIAVGGTVLAALTVASHGGFLRHIILYDINRFELARIYWVGAGLSVHAVFCGVAALGVVQSLRETTICCQGARSLDALAARLQAAPDKAATLLLLIYLLILTLMLVLMGKSGSNINYMIEWMMTAGLFAGLAVRDAARAVLNDSTLDAGAKRISPAAFLLPAALGVQALILPSPPTHARTTDSARIDGMRALSLEIRRAGRPVIADDMVLLLRSGQDVLWEPSIFAELASTGVWDERPFVAQIRARRFAFFITDAARGNPMFDSRYTPRVADAMDAAYPVQRRLAGYYLHYPASAIAKR
jgi:hypothetical protein